MFKSSPVFLILVLWLAGLGAAAQFAKIAVPFTEFATIYPDAGNKLGWLLSLISVFGIFMGMTASLLVSRFGYLRLLTFGLLLGALLSWYQSFLPGFHLMLFSRLLEGISHLLIVIAAPTLIAQIASDRYRGVAMTLWSTFFGVAFAVVAWFGQPIVDVHGLDMLLDAHAGFMVIVTILLLLSLKSVALPPRNTRISLSPAAIITQHVRTYRSPYIAAPAIGWLFYTLTFVSLLAILPFTIPEEQRASIVGLLPLVSIASALIAVPLLMRFVSAITITAIGFALAAFVGLLALANVPMSIISVSLFAVLGLVQGASFAAIPQLNHTIENRSLANGAMAQMGNLGNTLGTPVLLIILQIAGIGGVMIAVSAFYIAAIAAHLALSQRRQKTANSE